MPTDHHINQKAAMPEMDNKQLWENVLVDIELNISKANFSTWFKDTHIVKREDGVVYLSVPNQFVKDWLSTKYHKFILKALRGFAENVRGLEYVIAKESKRRREEPQERVGESQLNAELPLSEYYINKNDNLNPRYTFESFIVGPFNELAHAAAQAVVAKPGISYNPLFIYGQTGYGKTHLLQAVGNYFKKGGGRKVYYVTSEKFTMDVVGAIQNASINTLKEKYRQYDVLIMDDIQFLSGKEKTQEELFHLFNALHDNNKQIIFSSDKHPHYIQNLEDRLKSRFAAGMIVDISHPDHESRVAILKSKVAASGFPLENDIIEFLAQNISGNIRELEGILNTIICHTQLKGGALSLAEVKELIKHSSAPKKTISIVDVIKRIAEFYQIDEASIYEKTRRKEVVKPRQLIMYILREDFQTSYPTIGDKLGGRDHTTVIHSCEKIRNDLKKDPTLVQELDQVRALLK